MPLIVALASLFLWIAAADGDPAEPLTERSAQQILVTFEHSAPVMPQQTGPRTKYFSRKRHYSTPIQLNRVVKAIESEYGVRQVDAWPIRAIGVHCVVFEILGGRPAQELVTALQRDSRVETAQPMQLFDVLTTRYDDPYLHLQYGVHSMQIEAAHRWASGRGVKVAVIDTGVDVRHPELRGRVIASEDFVSRGADDGGDRHGTAVAGVIASSAGNGIGIVGVAPDARLLVAKACWQASADTGAAVCSSFTLAKALGFAIDRAPQVINLSLAGPADPLLERLLEAALARGIVVVAASREDASRSFPATMPEVIAVRAAGEPSSTTATRSPDPLAAPGLDVLTTVPRGLFDFASGSSLAAAHVSGVAALLLELRPQLKAPALRLLLQETSRRAVSGSSSEQVLMINACAALAALLGNEACPAEEPVLSRG